MARSTHLHSNHAWRICWAVALLALLAIPACTDDCSDGPGIDNAIASAERWVRVAAWSESGKMSGTTTVELDVVPVGPGSREGDVRRETVRIHDSFAPGIEEAITREDAVYLAMASDGLDAETVSYVVTVDHDQTHHLVGDDCFARGESFLRERLGDDFDPAMANVIGLTDHDQILSLLGADPSGY